MKENINIPNFGIDGKYIILYSIMKYGLTDEFILPENLEHEILEHYNIIYDLFKSYSKFDMYLFTKAFVIIYL